MSYVSRSPSCSSSLMSQLRSLVSGKRSSSSTRAVGDRDGVRPRLPVELEELGSLRDETNHGAGLYRVGEDGVG